MDTLEEVLAHYGVPGMKWGKRKSSVSGPTKVQIVATPGKGVKATGGTGQSPHQDAAVSAALKQTARKSTTDALSDAELKRVVNRMNLEQQYGRLRPKSAGEQIAGALSGVLLTAGKQQASVAANNEMGKRLKAQLG